MMTTPPLSHAIELVGLKALANACAVTYQAIRKWEKAGRLPRTEWTGETNYAASIERVTDGHVTKTALMEMRVAPQSQEQEAA